MEAAHSIDQLTRNVPSVALDTGWGHETGRNTTNMSKETKILLENTFKM